MGEWEETRIYSLCEGAVKSTNNRGSGLGVGYVCLVFYVSFPLSIYVICWQGGVRVVLLSVTASSCTGRVRLEACRNLAGEAWEEGSRCLKYWGAVPLFSAINSVLSFEPGVSWDELWVTREKLLNVPSAACGFGRAAPRVHLLERMTENCCSWFAQIPAQFRTACFPGRSGIAPLPLAVDFKISRQISLQDLNACERPSRF